MVDYIYNDSFGEHSNHEALRVVAAPTFALEGTTKMITRGGLPKGCELLVDSSSLQTGPVSDYDDNKEKTIKLLDACTFAGIIVKGYHWSDQDY